MPLFGLKTLLAFFSPGSLAAIFSRRVSFALHDIALPLMPLIYGLEYGVGYFLLSNPHRWPAVNNSLERERLSRLDEHSEHRQISLVGVSSLLHARGSVGLHHCQSRWWSVIMQNNSSGQRGEEGK